MLVFTYGALSSPRSILLRQQAGTQHDRGFDVFVHEVIAAITTEP